MVSRNVNGVDVELTPEEEAEWQAQQALDAAEGARIQAEFDSQLQRSARRAAAIDVLIEKGVVTDAEIDAKMGA